MGGVILPCDNVFPGPAVALDGPAAYSVRALRVSQYARYNFLVCGPKCITSPVGLKVW